MCAQAQTRAVTRARGGAAPLALQVRGAVGISGAVEVTLHGDDHWAEIAVADDGVGGARAEDGSGLRGLGDRVEALGGRLTLASTPGQGTTVRARVPVAPADAAVFSPLA